MNFQLVVRQPFKTYQKGDVITDAATVAKILASAHKNHVVKVAAPAAK